MASVVWENDSAWGCRWLFTQMSPQSHKAQIPLIWLLSVPPFLCWSPGWVATNKILYIVSLRGCLCLQWTLVFLAGRNPTAFHGQMLCGHLFFTLSFWAGEPGWGLDPTLSGNSCSWDIPPEPQPQPVGTGPGLLCLCTSHQSQDGFLCKSLGIRLLFS